MNQKVLMALGSTCHLLLQMTAHHTKWRLPKRREKKVNSWSRLFKNYIVPKTTRLFIVPTDNRTYKKQLTNRNWRFHDSSTSATMQIQGLSARDEIDISKAAWLPILSVARKRTEFGVTWDEIEISKAAWIPILSVASTRTQFGVT